MDNNLNKKRKIEQIQRNEKVAFVNIGNNTGVFGFNIASANQVRARANLVILSDYSAFNIERVEILLGKSGGKWCRARYERRRFILQD